MPTAGQDMSIPREEPHVELASLGLVEKIQLPSYMTEDDMHEESLLYSRSRLHR